MFGGSQETVESRSGRVVIASIQVVEKAIAFVYSGTVQCDDVDDYQELLLFADRYDVAGLTTLCLRELRLALTLDNEKKKENGTFEA